MAPQKDSQYRLTVEGTDDVHSIIHLMKRHGLDWDSHPRAPYVHDAGSDDELLRSIPITVRTQKIAGFVLDADDNLESRWHQLSDRFKEQSIQLPDEPPPQGLIADGFLPDSKVGIWLMPDNQLSGNLEHFLTYLVPAESTTYEFAGDCVVEARAKGAPCSERDHLKAQIHTWLAWQEKPGMPYGQAITAKVFEKDSEVAEAFVGWFNALYGL